jgi:Cu2+-exporting ATPase
VRCSKGRAANESLLTGESARAQVARAAVIGGAVNIESPIFVKVEQVGEATRLSAIVRLMERAAMEKPRHRRDGGSHRQPLLISLLALAAASPSSGTSSILHKALWITVSVLVVTCPCALSLATPVALSVASGAMARAGLLVTRSHAIETLARATHFVFDKTGTLTTGRDAPA